MRYLAALELLEARDASSIEHTWLLIRLARLLRFNDSPRGLWYVDAAQPGIRAAANPSLEAYALKIGGLLRCFAGQPGQGVRELAAGVA